MPEGLLLSEESQGQPCKASREQQDGGVESHGPAEGDLAGSHPAHLHLPLHVTQHDLEAQSGGAEELVPPLSSLNKV